MSRQLTDFNPTATDPIRLDAVRQVSRRGVLRAGGITIGLAALLSACGDDVDEDQPSRVGSLPPPSTLPPGERSDGVLFRTATSIHYSIIDALAFAKEIGELDASQATLVDTFIAANTDAIADMDKWTVTAGSQVWTCANPRFNRVVLDPIMDHITGRPAEGVEEADVPPSDDPNRDAMALVWAMETLAGEMHQSFVPVMSKPEYRGAVMQIGQGAARRSAATALAINPANIINPSNVISANPGVVIVTDSTTTSTSVQDIAQPDSDETTTTVPTLNAPQQYYAIPSQFGLLGPVQLAVGAPSAGTQFTINIETPSYNSYVYDYQTDADCP